MAVCRTKLRVRVRAQEFAGAAPKRVPRTEAETEPALKNAPVSDLCRSPMVVSPGGLHFLADFLREVCRRAEAFEV